MVEQHSGFKGLGAIHYRGTVVLGDDDATPSVADGNIFMTATGNSVGTLNITNFDGTLDTNCQPIIIISSNPTNKTVINDNGTINIQGSWTDDSERTLSLMYVGSVWYETARSF